MSENWSENQGALTHTDYPGQLLDSTGIDDVELRPLFQSSLLTTFSYVKMLIKW